MNIKKTLEQITTPVRLGWHGVVVFSVGTILDYCGVIDKNELMQSVGSGLQGMGTMFYLDSLKGYLVTRSHLKKHNELDERILKPNLKWYCNRQGARTAAANANFENVFDDAFKKYKKHNRVYFDYLPHI